LRSERFIAVSQAVLRNELISEMKNGFRADPLHERICNAGLPLKRRERAGTPQLHGNMTLDQAPDVG
jgi:hypothetical protein